MNKKHYNIPIFIPHLGCPFNCIFCDQKKISSQHQVPSITETVKIIEQHLSTIPAESEVEIAFFGGNFTSIPQQIQLKYLSAVNPYLRSGLVKSIRVSTRPDCIDRDILAFLQQWGVKTIELGVQSLSDKVLKASARGYKAEDVFKASRLIKEEQFKLGIQLMIGLPGDSFQLDQETTALAISLKPDMVRIYPTLILTGTVLETMYLQGAYTPTELPKAIRIAMHMFLMFQNQGIEVIRMGLHPGEDLRSQGTIVAGPFHPSFGELVEQEIFKEQALLAVSKLSSNYMYNSSINFYINPRDMSKLIGNRKNNIDYLKKFLGCREINIKLVAGNERNWVGVSFDEIRQPIVIVKRTDFIEKYLSTKF
jgi:histone acetyltransferase (RNA polymerase elongator complex component)